MKTSTGGYTTEQRINQPVCFSCTAIINEQEEAGHCWEIINELSHTHRETGNHTQEPSQVLKVLGWSPEQSVWLQPPTAGTPAPVWRVDYSQNANNTDKYKYILLKLRQVQMDAVRYWKHSDNHTFGLELKEFSFDLIIQLLTLQGATGFIISSSDST